MSSQDEFQAEWRASAHEAVPYSNEIPECFLILPEWTDGAIAQGECTKITITLDLFLESNKANRVTVTDNGKGVTNKDRLISWASKESTNVHHRYGHGSKKCLTKWNKDYNSNWYAKYRTVDKRGSSGSLFTFKGPYMGAKTRLDEDEEDENTLWPSGLEWSIEFEKETLRDISSPQQVFDVVKEVLRTRYSKKYFDKVDFILCVNNEGALFKRESSKEMPELWKTFRECLDDEVLRGTAVIRHDFKKDFNGIQIDYCEYYLTHDGRVGYKDTLQKEFPIYGGKNMRSTKLHTSLDGRIIELIPMIRFTNTKALHNSDNGYIGFANFTGKEFDKMPTPCTTKVSFRDSCPNYQLFKDLIREHREQTKCDCVLKFLCKTEGCTFTTLDNSVMDLHSMTHLPALLCKDCAFVTLEQSELTDHIIRAHKPALPKFECSSKCGFTCVKKTQLAAHEKTHHIKLACKACDFTCEKEEDLVKHKLTHVLKCDSCSFTSENTVSLATHKKTHVPKYVCDFDECMFTADSEAGLSTHKKTHKAAKKDIPKKVKTDVWNTYIGANLAQHRCLCCKRTLISMTDFECGHVISEKEGGGMEISNFRPICRTCNNSMGSKNMEAFVIKHKYYIG